MTLEELNKEYWFHDSILEKIEHGDDQLILYCTFCEFMQSDYDDSHFANSDIIVTFHKASYKLENDFCAEGASFLNQKLTDDSIVFFVEDDSRNYGELCIKADSVDIVKTRFYNL